MTVPPLPAIVPLRRGRPRAAPDSTVMWLRCPADLAPVVRRIAEQSGMTYSAFLVEALRRFTNTPAPTPVLKMGESETP